MPPGGCIIAASMNLTTGTRVGPYEILGKLGEGGMGEVYRARDAKLNREIALKIVPELVAGDPDRLARFEREAQVLAAMNHPNIAAIYGVEDSGPVRALVLELVEGPTLADRISAGAIPVPEALAIARQLADALAYAHDAGVIHRDLKPANIKVRDDGTVKVLDFGLAKALGPDGSSASSSAMNSPTLTARATEIGMIIGTAAYMAPEQARGKAVDRRADLWAFGVVLYEMLTGRRAFQGPEVSDVLAAVLRDTPPLDALPNDVPLSVKRLLRRTLEKDRARRLDSMTTARLELDDADQRDAATAVNGTAGVRGSRVMMIAAAALVVGATATGLAVWNAMQPAPPAIQRFSVVPGAEAPISVETNHNDVAITPDGTRLIYFSRADENADTRLFVSRAFDSFTPASLKLTDNARSLFLSPDGDWVVFQSGQPSGLSSALNKAPVAGGGPTVICPIVGNLRGASWLGDTIVFATVHRASGLERVAASGGTPTSLTTPATDQGELDHLWPEQLPGGRHVLFAVDKIQGSHDIALLDVESGKWRTLIPNASFPRYSPTGHILYGSAGTLRAVPFDADRMEITGDSIQIVPGIVMKESGAVDFALSRSGTLAYLPGEAAVTGGQLAWRTPDGVETKLAFPPNLYLELEIAPDGRRAATLISDGGNSLSSVWLLDLEREVTSRLTPLDISVTSLAWSPDSRSIAIAVEGRKEPGGVFLVSAAGTSAPERLTTEPPGFRHAPDTWTPDGRSVLLAAYSVDRRASDIMRVDIASKQVTAVLSGPDYESRNAVSPDGKWLAYQGIDRDSQIYLRPYPDVDAERIPVGPGIAPAWSADGRTLYYRTVIARGGELMSVSIAPTGNRVTIGKPAAVGTLNNRNVRNFAYPPIRGRYLVTAREQTTTAPTEYRVVVNFFEELKTRAKAKK